MNIFSSINTIFNNREIAIGLLLMFFIIFCLSIRSIRKPIISVVKSILKIKILISIFLIAIYGLCIVLFLKFINYWDFGLLKDTILWYCVPGFIMMAKYITSMDDCSLVKRIIIYNLKFFVIFEFIVNFYVSPRVWIEIIIILTITFIIVLDVVAKSYKKYKSVSKFLRALQFLFGLSITIYVFCRIIKDFNNFWSINTLKEFLLPIILTITFIPLIFFSVLYSRYEQFFCRLDYYYKDDRRLRIYIKKMTIRECLFSYRKVSSIDYNWRNYRDAKDIDSFFDSLT